MNYSDKTLGIENYHGVLDVWVKNNIPGYAGKTKNSTSMALTAAKVPSSARTEYYREFNKYIYGLK